jgi:hypothetical protein
VPPMTLDRPDRGPGPGRPTGIPLPPEPMPRLRGGRMLKRWRYVGAYGPELMLCAGAVQIGVAHQAFWAVWEREPQRLHERTQFRRGRVQLPFGRVQVDDGPVAIELELAEQEAQPVEVVTPDGRSYAWTQKRAPVRARGSVRVDGASHEVDLAALIDESAGYHARHTAWTWSAGVGAATDGRPLAWNLVAGIHDSPRDSERTVWVDGAPREVEPVDFADDLSEISFAEGGSLRFAGEAVRARRDNILLIRSLYEQPFGTFTGTLPGGVELAEGYGVMERHVAVW